MLRVSPLYSLIAEAFTAQNHFHLAYDMEDILDEFAYELIMRRELMGAEAEEASTSKVRRFISSFCICFNPTHVVRNVKMGPKIGEITSRLQDISARKAGLGLEKLRGTAATSAWQRPPPTTPIAYEPHVYGGDEDKTLVLDLLRKVEPNENNVSVISIVGLVGVGKTTLARLVYNDDLAKNFELKAWVCVNDVFDVENITKAILNSVLNSDASGSLDFQQVQKKLRDTLAGKTLFLILDDVRNENYCNWDRLRAPFSVVGKGSKVIVTTRNKNVALMMGAAKNVHELNPLSEEDCWSVFEKHAFEHRNINDHPNLVSIGRKIVAKCGGLPLVAKVLAETRHSSFILGKFDVFKKFEAFQEFEHLRTFVALPIHGTFTESFVTSLLRVLSLSEYMIFELPDSIGGLKHLCYLNLSFTQIKLLPDSVTNLYNVQTLILSNCEHLTRLPSNIGNLISLRHLNAVGCSLQEMPQQIGKLKKLQTLSDFIVAKRGFLGIKCWNWSQELNGSHNEDTEMEVLLSLQPHTNLKELRIDYYRGRKFPNWMCDSSYSKLVALSLIGCIRCISLPSVGQLPFLKKLVIKKMDGVKSVGLEFEGQEEWCWSTKSFSRLRQLEIKNCPRLIKKLPTHLTSLVKLSIENCPETMVPLPTHLPSLEELNIYCCPEMTPQFTTMNFSLFSGISGLSRLQPKFMQYLLRLELPEIDNSGQLQCLWKDGLGIGNLSGLRISGCNQLVSFGEEEEQGLNLQRLEIWTCDKLERLPHGLRSYTSLAELIIEDCPKLVSFPEMGFPLMLRGLAISNCESLSSLPDRMMMRNGSNNECHLEYLEIEERQSLICFPKGRLRITLRRLFISHCENLVSLPEDIDVFLLLQQPSVAGAVVVYQSLPEGIVHHHSNNTTNCGLQILDIFQGSSLSSFSTGKFPSTHKSITIDNCAQLQPISEEMFHCYNNALEELFISGLPNLKTIPDCFHNLKHLRIEKCENLDLQPHLLRNLTSLASLQIIIVRISKLTSLRTLTIGGIATSFSNHHHHLFLLPTTLFELCISSFQNLESLAFLYVFQCPKLQSFIPREGLPDMLSELYIRDCPLLIQRCSKEKGEDWLKFAHIPCVKIDGKLIFEQ
ncbi:hypothetical protein PVL29_017584 [Vitis rotundifolia]|uniref:NB-ARC domain-containing protein n=1 Tax=Vitis rotundifolia TaxID=103349 RepID=A0AA39DIV0_VITRO|nr:hypothetical protein PVL29_017584 [Vitis rotundifolia]